MPFDSHLLFSRVRDDLPLYDILNEFQKGHSHMAVVVKCMKGVGATIEDASKNVSMFEKRMFLNTMQTAAEDEGITDEDFGGHTVCVLHSRNNIIVRLMG